MIPKLFGFPLWKGKIKRRVAKKWLRYFGNAWFFKRSQFAHLGLGDIINDCTGNNGRIQELFPYYHQVGKSGYVLVDVDLRTTNTGCSLCGCGIEPQLSREEIEARKIAFAREWALDDSGEPGTAKHWFGSDTKTYDKVIDYSKRMIAEIESGGHVVDENGLLLPEWKKE